MAPPTAVIQPILPLVTLVLRQTHHSEHPLLMTLLSGDYPAFAEAELDQREAAALLPFSYLAMLRAEAKQVEAADGFLQAARRCIAKVADDTLENSKPLPAPMPRRAVYQRSQLLLSAPNRPGLHEVLDWALGEIYALPEAQKVRWSLDVDPIDLY